MHIADNVLREYLRDVYFVNGTAYAGKSTMVRMLADKHGMICCGENYHGSLSDRIATPQSQPSLSYFKTMESWQAFIHRTPEEYAAWIDGGAQEAGEFEVAQLIALSAQGKRIIVDTNLSVERLWALSDYRHVAIMLSPQAMSVDRFFDREDAEKRFLLSQIEAAEDPAFAMENFRACMARINSPEVYAGFESSGFFTLYRENTQEDTRDAVLRALEAHFGLDSETE